MWIKGAATLHSLTRCLLKRASDSFAKVASSATDSSCVCGEYVECSRTKERASTAPWPWEERSDLPAVRAQQIHVVFPMYFFLPSIVSPSGMNILARRASQCIPRPPSAQCGIAPRAVPRVEKFSRHALHTAPVARRSRHYESCPFLDRSLHSDSCQDQRSTNCFTRQ